MPRVAGAPGRSDATLLPPSDPVVGRVLSAGAGLVLASRRVATASAAWQIVRPDKDRHIIIARAPREQRRRARRPRTCRAWRRSSPRVSWDVPCRSHPGQSPGNGRKPGRRPVADRLRGRRKRHVRQVLSTRDHGDHCKGKHTLSCVPVSESGSVRMRMICTCRIWRLPRPMSSLEAAIGDTASVRRLFGSELRRTRLARRSDRPRAFSARTRRKRTQHPLVAPCVSPAARQSPASRGRAGIRRRAPG